MLSGGITGPGCAAGDGMVDKLYDSTRAYNRSLRWGDWDRAVEHIPAESANAFMEAHEAVEDRLVVIDYEMTRMEVDKTNGIAISQVEISWHTENELVVRSTKVNHLWQWHEGRWVLVDERRDGGKPLAIFAEIEDGENHPYLPGLQAFREENAIGMDDAEKRKRDRAKRKADKANAVDPTDKYSLEKLQSMPVEQRPASFN
ncbi:hypothetical protein DB30_05430 [Enhygromyxa salina]|uniref:Uncharacterized protein n=1 Tax=Enhygromyxa salina TaxID=215803 RepID=A0A0C2D6M1_9BACT|nr:hypothetical protein DB30_05430 [Enhygromyxa salina]